MDATARDTCELFEIGGARTEGVWPSYGLPCSALACNANCPPLGAVASVAIETLQPNSYGERALPRRIHSTSRHMQRIDLWTTSSRRGRLNWWARV
jgi:hypothetical protein